MREFCVQTGAVVNRDGVHGFVLPLTHQTGRRRIRLRFAAHNNLCQAVAAQHVLCRAMAAKYDCAAPFTAILFVSGHTGKAAQKPGKSRASHVSYRLAACPLSVPECNGKPTVFGTAGDGTERGGSTLREHSRRAVFQGRLSRPGQGRIGSLAAFILVQLIDILPDE